MNPLPGRGARPTLPRSVSQARPNAGSCAVALRWEYSWRP